MSHLPRELEHLGDVLTSAARRSAAERRRRERRRRLAATVASAALAFAALTPAVLGPAAREPAGEGLAAMVGEKFVEEGCADARSARCRPMVLNRPYAWR